MSKDTATLAEPLDLISIASDDFMRLSAVRVRFSDNDRMIPVIGENAEGKTSLLDLIEWGFKGPDAKLDMPVRKGADSTWVEYDLALGGDDGNGSEAYTVRRTKTESTHKLTVTKKGRSAPEPSPQALLNKLFNACTFDPMAFLRDEKKQAETLRKITGVDTKQIDADRADLYHRRTEVNREAERLAGVLNTFPVHKDVPAEPLSMADLTAKHAAARKEIDKANLAAHQVDTHKASIANVNRLIEAQSVQINKIVQQLQDARKLLAKHQEDVAALTKLLPSVEMAATEARALCPDIAGIEAAMEDAEEINKKVNANAERNKFAAELSTYERNSNVLTAEIKKLDAKKLEMLAATTMPIDGLSIEGDAVLFNGVPLAQASGAQKIRVGLAIGKALNPRLRLILIRDGSLIDVKGMKIVAEWAREHSMRVLVERVAEGCQACEGTGFSPTPRYEEEPCAACEGTGYRKNVPGIVIEDGNVTYGNWGG